MVKHQGVANPTNDAWHTMPLKGGSTDIGPLLLLPGRQ